MTTAPEPQLTTRILTALRHLEHTRATNNCHNPDCATCTNNIEAAERALDELIDQWPSKPTPQRQGT